MRILIHDFAGHAFQAQLSRELAERGADVLHLYSAEIDTPQGAGQRSQGDPADFEVRGLRVDCPHRKHQLVKRFRFERKYAAELIRQTRAFAPDIMVMANTPSIVLGQVAGWASRTRTPWINWVQDLYGLAAYRVLSKKLPGVGAVVGRYFLNLDKRAYRAADRSVTITDDFQPVLHGYGVDPATIQTTPNWAPLADLPQRPRENFWAERHGLGEGLRFIYSGSLAMKHNPALLLALGEWLQETGAGTLLVNAQSAAVDWLQRRADEKRLGTVRCLGYQPYEELPEVFGAADVLIAVLEPDASTFSVPSKVLSYLCAGRTLLAAIPGANLAAQTIVNAGAGSVVEPDDVEGFVAAAKALAASEATRRETSAAARAYAERTFDIARIADRFEGVLRSALDGTPLPDESETPSHSASPARPAGVADATAAT